MLSMAKKSTASKPQPATTPEDQPAQAERADRPAGKEFRIKAARGFRTARVTAQPGQEFTAAQVGGETEAAYLIAQGLADRI